MIRQSLLCLSLATMSCAPARTTTIPMPSSRTGGILLLADPQIHNPTGHSLKNQGWFADGIANVAVRPPALNLLAPVTLEELVANATAASHQAALVLGDATNLGCWSELNRFAKAMSDGLARNAASLQGSSPTFWLMAHGNHDSYMGGNFSTYERYRGPSESGFAIGAHFKRIPCGLQPGPHCGKPNDYAWWNAQESFDGAYEAGQPTSWPAICADPTKTSFPTNKGVWLAWYLDHLQSLGANATLRTEPESGYLSFGLHAAPGTKLGSISYSASGVWAVPEANSPSDVYASFIVQSFDVANYRVVIFDSSDGYLGKLAGTHGRISRRQREHLYQHVTKSAKRVVLAGHYPLSHFDLSDREYLIEIGKLRNGGAGVEFWSGHTHAPTSVHSSGSVAEINVGSTTDWPMEVSVRDMTKPVGTASALRVYSLMRPTDAPDIDATWRGNRNFDLVSLTPDANCTIEFDAFSAIRKRRSQACAHDADALRIVAALSAAGLVGWDQSEGRECGPTATHAAAWSLHDSLAAIDAALATSAGHARAVCIALAASKAEGVQIGWKFATERMRARRFERAMRGGVE